MFRECRLPCGGSGKSCQWHLLPPLTFRNCPGPIAKRWGGGPVSLSWSLVCCCCALVTYQQAQGLRREGQSWQIHIDRLHANRMPGGRYAPAKGNPVCVKGLCAARCCQQPVLVGCECPSYCLSGLTASCFKVRITAAWSTKCQCQC